MAAGSRRPSYWPQMGQALTTSAPPSPSREPLLWLGPITMTAKLTSAVPISSESATAWEKSTATAMGCVTLMILPTSPARTATTMVFLMNATSLMEPARIKTTTAYQMSAPSPAIHSSSIRRWHQIFSAMLITVMRLIWMAHVQSSGHRAISNPMQLGSTSWNNSWIGHGSRSLI